VRGRRALRSSNTETPPPSRGDFASQAVQNEELSLVVPRASVRRNAFQMLTSQAVTWLFATVLSILVPWYLGPAGLGQFRLATSLWLIAAVFISLGTARYLSLEVARKAPSGLRLVGPILVIRTVAFVLAAVIVTSYALLVESDPVVVGLVLIIAVDQLLASWTGVFGAAFFGLERMATPARSGAIARLINAGLVLVVILVGGPVYAIASAGAVAAAWGVWFNWSRYRKVADVVFRGWRTYVVSTLRFSLPFLAASASLIVYQQIDIIVISRLADDTDLGWYATADALFGSLLFPATILMGSMFPTLGRQHAHDRASLERLVKRAFTLLMIVAVPIGFGIALIGPALAPTLWGDDFEETGTALVVLGPVAILTFGTILFGTVALATGRNSVWIIVLLGSAALTVPLDVLLVPWASDRYGNGALGGALAYLATESVQFMVGAAVICPFLWGRELVWRLIRVVMAGVLMLAAGWPVRWMLFPVPIAVCAVAYGCFLLLLGVLGPDERQLVRVMLRKMGMARAGDRWFA
jgi:O-antigen/teichoic acid export membrane protein